jgi:hypothetical protein
MSLKYSIEKGRKLFTRLFILILFLNTTRFFIEIWDNIYINDDIFNEQFVVFMGELIALFYLYIGNRKVRIYYIILFIVQTCFVFQCITSFNIDLLSWILLFMYIVANIYFIYLLTLNQSVDLFLKHQNRRTIEEILFK